MKEANYVFSALEEPDVEALMRIGTQKQLHVSDRLLTEGTHHDAIYLKLRLGEFAKLDRIGDGGGGNTVSPRLAAG